MFEGPLLVLTHSFCQNSIPPGGYLCETVEVVSGNVPVIGHAMVPAAAGQKVPIIKPQIESLFQRFNVMYRQLLIQTRNAIDTIAALVTDPAQVIIPADNLVSLLLPSIRLSEAGRLFVPVVCLLRLLRTRVSSRMNPPTILA